MQLTLLGTSCSIPTKDRNTAGYFLKFKRHGILLDCGEAIQRQMKIFGIKLSAVTKILITHWHGDHVLGLGGLLQSISGLDHVDTLQIYGPVGTKKYFDHLFKSLAFELKIPLEIHEVTKGVVYEDEELRIETLPMKHRIVCQAYRVQQKDIRKIDMNKAKAYGLKEGPLIGRLQRGQSVTVNNKKITPEDVSKIQKGKSMVYITDTRPNDNSIIISKDADLVLCECVYEHKLAAKARKHMHLTARETGLIASKAGAKKLVLTHFSARYKETSVLEADARDVFDNVVAGYDGMKIRL